MFLKLPIDYVLSLFIDNFKTLHFTLIRIRILDPDPRMYIKKNVTELNSYFLKTLKTRPNYLLNTQIIIFRRHKKHTTINLMETKK